MSTEKPTPNYLVSPKYYQRSDGTWWYKKKTQDNRCSEYTCDDCGNAFYSPSSDMQYKQTKSKSGNIFCCRTCSNRGNAKIFPAKKGKDCHRWRGGKRPDGSGYIRVYSPDHPNATKDGYVREHRLVMEKHIGRLLLPKEEVHHKNGMRSDNRIENLELWTSSHPAGQRVSDQLIWAQEILATYKNIIL